MVALNLRKLGGTLGLITLGFLGPLGSKTIAAPVDLAQVMAEDQSAENPIVTVEELSDVKPTDWAYQSVKALIERYGLMNGSKIFRGNQPLTRFEFARVLNAVME